MAGDVTDEGTDHRSGRRNRAPGATTCQTGVPHSGVNDTDDPIPYSALIFRDPDNIQLELFHLPG